MLQLSILKHIPEGLLHCSARELHTVLAGPTLLILAGRRQPAVFLSALLHGNEDVGLKVLQAILIKYHDSPLPRGLIVFIGNVAAAEQGLRRLPRQLDFNRAWPGSDAPDCAEKALMTAVMEQAKELGLFLSIDLHNNTGLNPHYACVNKLDRPFLQLASLFCRTVVYFTRPLGVQSLAFAELCPAVTLECGKTGSKAGAAHAFEFVDACMHLDHLPKTPVANGDIDLFHTVATVKIAEHCHFEFGQGRADLLFDENIDHANFRELEADTLFAKQEADKLWLQAWDEWGEDVAASWFYLQNGELRLRKKLMPAMLSLDKTVIRQDCLCYLMERISHA